MNKKTKEIEALKNELAELKKNNQESKQLSEDINKKNKEIENQKN